MVLRRGDRLHLRGVVTPKRHRDALAAMKRNHKGADYDIHLPVDTGAVTSCVANAKKIIKLVRDARTLYDKQQEPRQA